MKEASSEYASIRKQLEVLQICDSTFPIGSFNHSYGMETYLRTNQMKDVESFEQWLLIFLKTQFTYGEGLVIRLCYQALDVGDLNQIWQYDQVLTLSSVAQETRNGNKMVAKQMLQLVLTLHHVPNLEKYSQKIQEGICYGSPAIVFAFFAYQENLSVEEAIMDYAYSILSTMVQNAVRAIPLGQKSGQIALQHSLLELESVCAKIMSLDKDLLGANMPGIELSQMRHETQVFRLFMS